MQKDFHFDVIYVLARYAEFSHEEAYTIAYSSQYVDDATHGGFIYFSNAPSYYHMRSVTCTDHKQFYQNLDETVNNHTWLPFHFVPGNDPGSFVGTEYEYRARMICRPNSEIAQKMVAECVNNGKKSLHRLGITLHSYADTWAHQGFAGVVSPLNVLRDIVDSESGNSFLKVISPLEDIADRFLSTNLNRFPLGHLTALHCPDVPYLEWKYIDREGVTSGTIRNIDRFMDAVLNIWMVLKRYQADERNANPEPIPDYVYDAFKDSFLRFDQANADKRHELWQQALREDWFGFGKIDVPYIPSGPGSWKSAALGKDNIRHTPDEVFEMSPTFNDSDWKKFHDAVMAHIDFMLNVLLPQHGVTLR